MPLAGVDCVDLFRMGQRVAAGLAVVQLRPEDMGLHQADGKLPPVSSFLQADGNVVVTSAAMVNGSLEVRCFNPTDDRSDVSITFARECGFSRFRFVNLESSPLDRPGRITDGRAAFAIEPRKIVTLRID